MLNHRFLNGQKKQLMKTVEFTKQYIESIAGVKVDDIYSDIAILYYGNSDNILRLAKIDKWESLEAGGEIAQGVVVFSGREQLVIAPNGSAKMPWSSERKSAPGATQTTIRRTAINDWGGESNTAAIISASASDFITDTIDYAPGYCNLYARANTSGNGMTAGKWWLPSLGELILMRAHLEKINYALSKISGANPIPLDTHWSSTQYSADIAWGVTMSTGRLGNLNKSTSSDIARPVSALQ